MNIQMSTFRLQLIDRHSTFLTVLVEGDNQIRQPVYTFSQKRFHTQSQEYLLVSYEFSISRSSIFEPASHRIPHPSSSRVPSSLLSRRTHRKLSFCVAMISRTENQKIFVQTQDENIKTKLPPTFFKFFVDTSVYLQRVRQKGDFQCILLFSTFEIIKMRIATKVSRYSP